MTLMTDDIEWYPLPEVDDIHDGTPAEPSRVACSVSLSLSLA